ncbi:hypothetical protein ACMFMG_004417 [Clarireedia jacksonii]
MRIQFLNGLLFASIFAVNVLGSSLGLKVRSESDQNVPSPLLIPPSQYFDGDDGAWSSLALRVGSPAQNVRVLVSTNSPQTLLVLPLGCTSAAISPVPSGCATARGALFNNTQSTTWEDIGTYGINGDEIGFQANLGYSQHADFGLDTIGLGYVEGTNGPTLKNQTIGAIATTSPFYMGIFGLGTQPLNFSTIGNFSSPSYFTSLWSEKLIPSLSWSYTAGASYRLKAGQYAQLIFGGYDSSRFTPNGASFTLSEDIDRDIVVAIQSITYSGTTQADLLPSPTYAFIQSTDPNFWLPEAACEAFEKAFGLSLDEETGLYLLNSTQRSLLKATNPQVTFSLSNALNGGESATIVLPFSAFSIPASYPFVPNDTYYFPLRKSSNDSQNTLGRAFLQEAYLTVDYERKNFSVSQCTWNDGAASELSTIISPSLISNSSSATSGTGSHVSSNHNKPISVGLICGLVALIVVAIAIIGFIIFYLRRRKLAASTNEVALRGMSRDDSVKSEPYATASRSLGVSDGRLVEAPVPDVPRVDPVELHSHDREVKPAGFYMALQSPSELYTPISTNHNEDYETAARMIESQRRAQRTPELPGSPAMYELPGDCIAAELDDESSRRALSSISLVSRQSSSQDMTSHLLAHTTPRGRSPSLSPLLSPTSSVPPHRSSNSSTSHLQGRISPFEGLARQSTSSTSPMITDPSHQTEPPVANRRSTLPRPSTVFTEDGSEPATPVVMVSPTLGRPPSSFMRSFSRSGTPLKKQRVTSNAPSAYSDATLVASWHTPRDSSWFT